MSKAMVGVALVGGLVFGGAGGFYMGYKAAATAIVTLATGADCQGAEETIDALEHLRAGAQPEALEAMESHLNGHLVALTAEVRGGIAIADIATKRIGEVRARAKAYRAANPRPPSEKLLDKDAAKFLAGE